MNIHEKTLLYKTEHRTIFGLRLCFYHAEVTLHQQTDGALFLSRSFDLQVGQGASKGREREGKVITRNYKILEIYIHMIFQKSIKKTFHNFSEDLEDMMKQGI